MNIVILLIFHSLFNIYQSIYLSNHYINLNYYYNHKMSSHKSINDNNSNNAIDSSINDLSISSNIINYSERVNLTESPYIEDILDKYSNISDISVLSLGSSYWGPPSEAINKLSESFNNPKINKYGSIEGDDSLREMLLLDLHKRGVNVDDLTIMITAGANQAFNNIALCLTDHNDNIVLLAPYYFSHKLSLQLATTNVIVCPFDKSTLLPNWTELEAIFINNKPKMVVLTTPNNPSGLIWSNEDIDRLVSLCKLYNTWLVCDQTYHEFTFENVKHNYPCIIRLSYPKIIHIFSLSKSYGMAGWRVGYLIYPKTLAFHMRKIQDTIPTHASMISQQLAQLSIQANDEQLQRSGQSWVSNQVASLQIVRDLIWEIVEPLGTVKTYGAFYFLVPLPVGVSEEEAVDILATKYQVMLMLGWPFGAPNHLRLSYGNIPSHRIESTMQRLKDGFNYIKSLANDRNLIVDI